MESLYDKVVSSQKPQSARKIYVDAQHYDNTMTLTAYLSNPIYLTYMMVPLQTLIPNGPLLPLFLRLILTHDEFIIHNYGLNKFTNRYLLKEIGFY